MALIGIAAALTRPPFDVLAVAPTLVGLAAGYLVMSALVNRLARVEAESAIGPSISSERELVDPSMSSVREVDRRAFLRLTVLVGAGALVAAAAGRLLVGAAAKINEARSKIVLPPPKIPGTPVPAGAASRCRD